MSTSPTAQRLIVRAKTIIPNHQKELLVRMFTNLFADAMVKHTVILVGRELPVYIDLAKVNAPHN